MRMVLVQEARRNPVEWVGSCARRRATLLLAVGLTFSALPVASRADDAPAGTQPQPQKIDLLRLGYASLQQFEIVEMVSAVVRGSQMGPGEGWFHSGKSRYGPHWLAAHYDANHDNTVTREEFKGPAEFFERLDRDGDGILTIDDFDWSDQSQFLREASMAIRPFFAIDKNSNGRISREEWEAFFERSAHGKDHVTPEDLRRMLQPPRRRRTAGERSKDEPTPLVLFSGLLRGELGSMLEGPRIDQPAPLFTLQTQDGKQKVALADYRGKTPVVLIFGSFT